MDKKEDVEIVISKYGTKLPLVPFSNPQAILVIGKEKQIVSNKQKIYWRGITMNGTRPKFMENQILTQSYFEQPNPYVNAPSCHVNLLELSRYAKRCGKKLVELTQEEVKKFSI